MVTRALRAWGLLQIRKSQNCFELRLRFDLGMLALSADD
jgi:hypothetical protein